MIHLSGARLYALRLVYLLNFCGGLLVFWPPLLNPAHPVGSYEGFAFSLWAGLMSLMGLGIRYPLQMLPMLLMQLLYKTIWLSAVALPLWTAGRWDHATAANARLFITVVFIDILVIPWRHVLANYVRRPGDR